MTESIAIARDKMLFAWAVAAFFVGAFAICGMLSGLKTSAELLFTLLESVTAGFVMFLLDVAQTNPPHFSRTVYALGSSPVQCVMCGFDLRMVLGKCDYN